MGVGRHIGEVIHDDEHLDDGTKRIEEGHLDGALLRNSVALFTQIYMTQIWRRDAVVVAKCVEENSDGNSLVLRVKAPGSPNFGGESGHRGHWLESTIKNGLLEIAQQI